MLGFEHEHQRFDRDDYVMIEWDNIYQDKQELFKKKIEFFTTLGTAYDYESVMHYQPRVGFSAQNPASEFTTVRLKNGFFCSYFRMAGDLAFEQTIKKDSPVLVREKD